MHGVFTLSLEYTPYGKKKKITVLDTSSRITNDLWNVNVIRWWCWNIATDEGEVNYWIRRVCRGVLFLILLRCRFQGDGQFVNQDSTKVNELWNIYKNKWIKSVDIQWTFQPRLIPIGSVIYEKRRFKTNDTPFHALLGLLFLLYTFYQRKILSR
jgi:hypothetical protein